VSADPVHAWQARRRRTAEADGRKAVFDEWRAVSPNRFADAVAWTIVPIGR
jgi:hypothetical protein